MILTGTLINAAAVIGGSLIGLAFHAKIPMRFTKTIFQGIALFTILLGVNMGLKSNAFLLIVFSLITGGFLGELLQIETKLSTKENYEAIDLKYQELLKQCKIA